MFWLLCHSLFDFCFAFMRSSCLNTKHQLANLVHIFGVWAKCWMRDNENGKNEIFLKKLTIQPIYTDRLQELKRPETIIRCIWYRYSKWHANLLRSIWVLCHFVLVFHSKCLDTIIHWAIIIIGRDENNVLHIGWNSMKRPDQSKYP